MTARAAMIVTFAVSAAGLIVPAGGATAQRAFSAVASARAASVNYTVPDYLVVSEVADVGVPAAQSVLESSERSSGFASIPYPGDTVITAPGTAAGFTGVSVPVTYPLFAKAVHPGTAEARYSDPSGQLVMHARAGRERSDATATSEVGVAGTASGGSSSQTTTRVLNDGTIVATAGTVTKALSLGNGALSIASVTSKATSTVRPRASKPVTVTELRIEGLAVAGQVIGIAPREIVVAGQKVPVAAGASLDAVNAALEPSGISMRILGARSLAGGSVAPVLEITSAHAVPVPGSPAGLLRLGFGGALTSVLLGAEAVGVPDVPEIAGVLSPPASATGGGGAAIGANPATGGITTGALPSALPQASSPSRVRARPVAGSRAFVDGFKDFNDRLKMLYLALGVAASFALAASLFWQNRRQAEPWTF